jgi:excisionase family DNA binding protein
MQKNIFISFSEIEFKELIKDSIREVLAEEKSNSNNHETDKLLNVSEASKFLNLAKQTIYGYTSQNLIPYIKRGKKLYFKKVELLNWLTEEK